MNHAVDRAPHAGDNPIPPPSRLDIDAPFLWGTSSSALQNEGARATRAETTWDRLADDGRIADGSDPSSASEHLENLDGDVALIAELGAGAHRFSVSWARVMADGARSVSESGLDHYDRMVDLLLEREIEPIVALHHWDLPQRHHDDGGWLDTGTVDAFVDFAGAVGARLGDRVETWSTLHDPKRVTLQGAPENQATIADHQLAAHQAARRVVRAHAPGARVGIELCDAEPRFSRSLDVDFIGVAHSGSASALRTTLTTFRHVLPGMPLIIMEEGVPSHDGVDLDGIYTDDDRIRELWAHIGVIVVAQRAGTMIDGYLAPLLDGFEWTEGLRRRTGLVRVEFETQERIAKESYRWYQTLLSVSTDG